MNSYFSCHTRHNASEIKMIHDFNVKRGFFAPWDKYYSAVLFQEEVIHARVKCLWHLAKHRGWLIWNDAQAQRASPCNVSMHYDMNGNESAPLSPRASRWFTVRLWASTTRTFSSTESFMWEAICLFPTHRYQDVYSSQQNNQMSNMYNAVTLKKNIKLYVRLHPGTIWLCDPGTHMQCCEDFVFLFCFTVICSS